MGNEYGCWCYFDDMHGKGKSHATDEIDAYCQVLAEGYDCAVLDADEEGDSCIPWEVEYESSTVNLEQIADMCADKNVGNCAVRACIVEQTFVTSIFQSFLFGYSMCQSEKSCCGEYPKRRVFKTHGGTRACCGSKTYDQDIMQCCSPDKVKLVC